MINLKANGVLEDDIMVTLMADHGLDLYGNVIANPDFAARTPPRPRALVVTYAPAFAEIVQELRHRIAEARG